jgi:hypothetical protein
MAEAYRPSMQLQKYIFERTDNSWLAQYPNTSRYGYGMQRVAM